MKIISKTAQQARVSALLPRSPSMVHPIGEVASLKLAQRPGRSIGVILRGRFCSGEVKINLKFTHLGTVLHDNAVGGIDKVLGFGSCLESAPFGGCGIDQVQQTDRVSSYQPTSAFMRYRIATLLKQTLRNH